MNNLIKNSYLASKVFVGEFATSLSDSYLGRIFRFSSQKLSLIFVLLAAAATWYEPLAKLIILGSIVDALPFVLLVLSVLFCDFDKIKLYKLHVWYFAFLALTMISGLLAIYSGRAEVNAVLYMVILVQFILALISAQSQKTDQLINGLLILGVPASVYGLWQFFGGGAIYSTGSLESTFARSSAFFTSPNIYGMFAVILFLVSVFQFKEQKNKVYILLAVIFFAGALTSLSRTAWVALIIGLIPLIEFQKLKLGNLGIIAGIKSRIGVIFSEEYWFNSAVDGRVWSLKNGLYILKQYPILGTGPGTYGGKFAEIYSSPVYFKGMQNGYVALMTTDNQYLAVLVQFGLVGFLAYVGFFLALALQIVLVRKNCYRLALAVLASFAIMMLTSNAFEFTAIAIPVALLAGISLNQTEAF